MTSYLYTIRTSTIPSFRFKVVANSLEECEELARDFFQENDLFNYIPSFTVEDIEDVIA